MAECKDAADCETCKRRQGMLIERLRAIPEQFRSDLKADGADEQFIARAMSGLAGGINQFIQTEITGTEAGE